MHAYILVNFGGPRNLDEIEIFLKTLLCDRDVIRSYLPKFFFARIAKKRTKTLIQDYKLIGGKSPIFEDTEFLAQFLRDKADGPVLTFHRYLPQTHPDFLAAVQSLPECEIRILPLFPQFTYATTGSIARYFSKVFPPPIVSRMRWIKSYPTHPDYIAAMQQCLRDYLQSQNLKEEETVLFFSPHGLPQKFIDTGDPYQTECQSSFAAISSAFPKALSHMAFQSKFGRGEWIRPYTIDRCHNILSWHASRPNIVFVPLSFTSDHIETLFEIEYQYLPIIRSHGLRAYRCPALNQHPLWLATLLNLLNIKELHTNKELIF